MSVNKIIVIFGIIFLIFGVIIFFQFNSRSMSNILGGSLNSKVTINEATFGVEVVEDEEERVKGLSDRDDLPEDQGMLFIFDKPSYYSFWMRGMKFPLDIIFILDDKIVAIYEDLQPAQDDDPNPPQWGADVVADKVLEINAGLVKENDIKVGDFVNMELE